MPTPTWTARDAAVFRRGKMMRGDQALALRHREAGHQPLTDPTGDVDDVPADNEPNAVAPDRGPPTAAASRQFIQEAGLGSTIDQMVATAPPLTMSQAAALRGLISPIAAPVTVTT